MGGVETGYMYMRYIPVILANVPRTFYVHRDIYEIWIVHVPLVHVPKYVLGQNGIEQTPLKIQYKRYILDRA